jgi:hypothetical protein
MRLRLRKITVHLSQGRFFRKMSAILPLLRVRFGRHMAYGILRLRMRTLFCIKVKVSGGARIALITLQTTQQFRWCTSIISALFFFCTCDTGIDTSQYRLLFGFFLLYGPCSVWIAWQRSPPMKGELRWRGANSISKFDHHNINGGAVDNTWRHR